MDFVFVEDHNMVRQRKTSKLKMLWIYWYWYDVLILQTVYFQGLFPIHFFIKFYINDLVIFYHSIIKWFFIVWNRSSVLWLCKVILVLVISHHFLGCDLPFLDLLIVSNIFLNRIYDTLEKLQLFWTKWIKRFWKMLNNPWDG